MAARLLCAYVFFLKNIDLLVKKLYTKLLISDNMYLYKLKAIPH